MKQKWGYSGEGAGEPAVDSSHIVAPEEDLAHRLQVEQLHSNDCVVFAGGGNALMVFPAFAVETHFLVLVLVAVGDDFSA